MLRKILNAIKIFLEPIAKLISNIVNLILLFVVYFVGIGIVSIFMKIFGKHFLEIKKKNKKSNWYGHIVTRQPLENYYRTF